MEVATNSDDGRDRNRLQAGTDDRNSDPLEVVVVYTELVQAGEPLSESDLADRTLLPDRTVDVALSTLERSESVQVLTPRVESRPTRYYVDG